MLQRFEKRLEGLVEGAFAKVFKGVVHPVEILNAMQREAEAHKAILAGGRTLVPNRYVIDLSPYDHSRLAPYAAALAQELAQSQAEFIGEQALDGLRRRDRRDRARRGAGHRHVPGHRRGLHRRRGRPGVSSRRTTPARPRYPPYDQGGGYGPPPAARRWRPQRPAGLRRRPHLPAADGLDRDRPRRPGQPAPARRRHLPAARPAGLRRRPGRADRSRVRPTAPWSTASGSPPSPSTRAT